MPIAVIRHDGRHALEILITPGARMSRLARSAVALGLLAFWGGLWLAAQRYPSEFDWRYMTISNLVSAEGNPAGHAWASAGIALCGVAGIGWAVQLAGGRDRRGVAWRSNSLWALGIGNFCMVVAALVPQRLPGIPKGHELLALLAFFNLCFALVSLTVQAVLRSDWSTAAASCRRALATVLAGAALSPVVLAALAQLYVGAALPQLHWVGLEWRAEGVPVYLSFAFWEWITCAVFSAYLLALSAAIVRR